MRESNLQRSEIVSILLQHPYVTLGSIAMGCAGTKGNLPFEMMMQFAESKKNMEDFGLLKLSTNKVRTLYNMYDFIAGVEGSGCSLYNFVSYVGITPTAFVQQMMTIFASEKFDFRTFVLSLWNYCTLTSKNMHLFVFDLYNIYGKALTPPDVITMLRDVYGAEKWKTNAFAHSTFKELCKAEERKESFTVYTFHYFMLNHKYLLIPAFQLQRTLRQKICGRAFWKGQTWNRESMYPATAYVSIAQLLNPTVQSAYYQCHRCLSDYYASEGRLILPAPRSIRKRRRKYRPRSAPAVCSASSAFSEATLPPTLSKDLVQDLQELSI